jgi:hypothetical protein
MSWGDDLLRSPDVTDELGQELPPRSKWTIGSGLHAVDTGTEIALSADAGGGSGDAESLLEKPLAALVGSAGAGQDGYVLAWDNASGEYTIISPAAASLPSGFGGQVLVRNVGSGDPEFAELLDANIDAAAAIAGTKVSPNFGAQNVVTTGFVAAGASPATAGTLRIGHAQAFQGLDQAGTGNEMLITWGIDGNDVMGLGSTSNAGMLYASGTSGALAGHHFYVGGTEYVTIDAGTMNLADGFVITWTDDSGPTTRRLLSVTEESLRIGDSTGSNGPYRIDLYAESGVRTHVNDAERFAVVDSGPAWDCIQHLRGTEQTTDATVTTLASVAPGNTKAGRVSVVVTAREATTQVVNIYSLQQSYETDGTGAVTLRGSPTVVAEDEDNAAWACALTVEIASPTVISVRVTGEAATTIDWRCAGQIMVA